MLNRAYNYTLTQSQVQTIRQWGQQYCSDENADELGGFILNNSWVTLEPNESPVPQHSFLCDWYKYPLERVVGIWHTHPGYDIEFLSQADYEFADWYGRSIVMYAPLYNPKAWDWYDPTGTIDFSILYKWRSLRAGYNHPSGQQHARFDQAARAIEEAERQVFEAYRQYIDSLRRAVQMKHLADETALASLTHLASECQNYRLKAALTDQTSQIKMAQYARQFLEDF